MTETEQRSLILRQRYDLTVPERSLIERGLALAESLGKKVYICPILGAKFVLIPAGTFMMGSPEDEREENDDEKQHQVTISKPFYMQKTQVTQGQWKRVMGNNPSFYREDDNLPVENVSWEDVQEFISNLNKREGANNYHLPTEAQWEYACRAGSATTYCFGDDPGHLGEYAWYYGNSGYKNHPVGQKKPNAWGLCDMHDDICEWCQDWFGDYPSGNMADPVGPSDGSAHVRRGGRSASRYWGIPGLRLTNIGFRLLRAVEQDNYESDRRVAKVIGSEQVDKRKKQIAKSKRKSVAKAKETGREGDFIAYDNETVLDTRTNMMWAAEDSGEDINWQDAKSYCDNYRGGGYSDWRMPTMDELEGLYDTSKSRPAVCNISYRLHVATELIDITCFEIWASETSCSDTVAFNFLNGWHSGFPPSASIGFRALPVRSGK